MLEPVFSLDLVLASRRSGFSRFRRIYSAWLIAQFTILCATHVLEAGNHGVGEPGKFVSDFLTYFLLQHLVVLIVATPALSVTALTDEQSRRTIESLLTTDLNSAAIIFGKFCSRFLQALSLASVGLPVLCFAAGYGHWPGLLVLGIGALMLALTCALTAGSILVSAASRDARQALFRAYASIAAIALTLWALPHWVIPFLTGTYLRYSSWFQSLLTASLWIKSLNPILVVEADWTRSEVVNQSARLAMVALVLTLSSFTLLLLASWRLRTNFQRVLEYSGTRRRRRSRAAPRFGKDLIGWKERLGENRWHRAAAGILIFVVSALLSRFVVEKGDNGWLLAQGVAVICLFGVVVALRTAGVISGERERSTWELLLLTPIESDELVAGKVGAVESYCFPYFMAYALPTVYFAWQSGAVSLSVIGGSLLATVSFMHFMAATGILWSASSSSSLRSLMGILAAGYSYAAGVLFLFFCISVAASCLLGPAALFLLIAVSPATLESGFLVYSSLATFVGASWLLNRAASDRIQNAESWIDAHERSGKTFARVLVRALRGHYDLHVPLQRAVS
jgi:ABC-type transport system involved in multi-copper enzyme maturation permease subunit